MTELKIPKERSVLAIERKRDVNLTMPWFSSGAKYPPRAANVLLPLINGQRAFEAVNLALQAAKKSIDIISWGFDPSMRLLRPSGERLGDILSKKGKAGLQVRVLVWKNALANLGENNVIGDGLAGSGGGSAGAGSGVGSTSPGNATGSADADGANAYGSKRSGRGSAGVLTDDPEAKAYNRRWFAAQSKGVSFRTRDFGLVEKATIEVRHVDKHGIGGHKQRLALSLFPSHHQKVLLVDYEDPASAVGFVMGHNLLRDYWDTDEHDYSSELRLGFKPWQDLSSRVHGPVLWDLNENFCTAWSRAQPWIGSDQPIGAQRKTILPSVFEAPAARHGKPAMAQITRTQPQENDRSILESYQLALKNSRSYLYFENQYFRNTELAMLLRKIRRELKSGGWKRELHIFVVTNVPDDSGRITTYEMMQALGRHTQMPKIDKKQGGSEDPDSRALRRADLEGVNIHVCSLVASGTQYFEPQAFETGRIDDWGMPEVQWGSGSERTVYRDIYVHSKLLLADDVFFTLGSANVNLRSMEVDSELNIAMTSPELTKKWRSDLWKIHTGRAPGDDPKEEFRRWADLMSDNTGRRSANKALAAPLIEFYDDASSGSRAD